MVFWSVRENPDGQGTGAEVSFRPLGGCGKRLKRSIFFFTPKVPYLTLTLSLSYLQTHGHSLARTLSRVNKILSFPVHHGPFDRRH